MRLPLPIGTTVIFKGRAYRFCGITPVSIQPTRALLEDLRTGACIEVPAVRLAGAHGTPDDASGG